MKTHISRDLLQALKGLSPAGINAVQSYVFFLKTQATTDPSQLYFWTRRWQELEKSATLAKRSGKILGNGSAKDLLRSLRKTK